MFRNFGGTELESVELTGAIVPMASRKGRSQGSWDSRVGAADVNQDPGDRRALISGLVPGVWLPAMGRRQKGKDCWTRNAFYDDTKQGSAIFVG